MNVILLFKQFLYGEETNIFSTFGGKPTFSRSRNAMNIFSEPIYIFLRPQECFSTDCFGCGGGGGVPIKFIFQFYGLFAF